MPIGVIINVLSVAIGGIVGAAAGEKFSDKFKSELNLVFGACSMGIGINSIILMKNMPAVIFAGRTAFRKAHQPLIQKHEPQNAGKRIPGSSSHSNGAVLCQRNRHLRLSGFWNDR